MTAMTDVVYSSAQDLRLDVYVPSEPNGAALLHIHGGGWIKGDKSSEAELAGTFAAQGYVVCVPNYRLAPDWRFPAQNDDITAALEWMRTSDLVFDRRRIGVFGSSAGGNLAAEAAVRHGLPIASWSGLLTLDRFIDGAVDVEPSPVADVGEADGQNGTHIDQGGRNDPYYKWCILQFTGGDPEVIRQASVEHRIDSATGPMFLANAIDEFIPRTEVEVIAETLARHSNPVVVQLIPGKAHAKGFQREAQALTLAFFAEHLLCRA